MALLYRHFNTMLVWDVVAQLLILALPQQLLEEGEPLPAIVHVLLLRIIHAFIVSIFLSMVSASLLPPFLSLKLFDHLLHVDLFGIGHIVVTDLLVFYRALFLLHHVALWVRAAFLDIFHPALLLVFCLASLGVLGAALSLVLCVAHLFVMLRTLGRIL